MVDSSRQFYEFGVFRIDVRKRRLLRDGSIVPLTPKAFDTLVVLIQNRDHVVEKEDLMDKVWPGTAVEENNLTQNISALRKALHEKRDHPEYILTVSGLGYRFIAEVKESYVVSPAKESPANDDSEYRALISFKEEATRKSGSRARIQALVAAALIILVGLAAITYRVVRRVKGATSSNGKITSIAVLPFKPLAAGETDEYLGIGMTDALINKLSSLKQITVRPTSSIMKYANSDTDPVQAANALQVSSVLDGRVQKIGDRIRITVQLIRASDGAPLWADKFDENYTDVFSVEDRISEQVAASLIPTLTGQQKQQLTRHYTENTNAYQSYIKGRYFWNKRNSESVKKAISYFEDAILQDPNYALAYAGLADSYTTLGILDDLPSQEMMPKARSAALKALELDNDLAEAHASLGYVKHRFDWDWPGAEKEFKRSLELNPDYATAHQWYGWYFISLGSLEAARREFDRAREIDPLSLYTNLTIGVAYFYSQQYEAAKDQFNKVIEMDQDFAPAHRWLAKTDVELKKYDEGIAEARVAIRISSDKNAETALGYAYSVSGKQSEARRILTQLEHPAKDRYVSPYSVAAIYSGLGEKDHAFAWLEKDLTERDNSMVFLAVDQQMINLHSDRRFADLVKRVGIPQSGSGLPQ